ncbi:MAG: hypothetical protein JNL10_01000, partial [Verrucomicrobiales bacterium]|nr:hypothetical protein [Verrucomicrobiales bacterium]
TGALIKSGTLGANGLFFLGVIEIPGTQPGGTGMVMLRGWDNSTGSSYASAILKGMVLISLHNLGGGGIPPPPLGAASDFLGGPFGPLTPPYTGPPTLFYLKGLQSHQLVADLPEGPSVWRLQASGDLVHWTQVGEPQPGGWSRTWSVPDPETSTFFRVVQEPLAP